MMDYILFTAVPILLIIAIITASYRKNRRQRIIDERLNILESKYMQLSKKINKLNNYQEIDRKLLEKANEEMEPGEKYHSLYLHIKGLLD